MARLLIVVTGCCISLALLLLGLRLVGGFRAPASAAILDVATCSQPCWHGIRPGATTLDEADGLLNADRQFVHDVVDTQDGAFDDGTRRLCWTLAADPGWQGCAQRDSPIAGTISRVTLESQSSRSFTLGDAILLLGNPAASSLCERLGFLYGAIYFPNDVEIDVLESRIPATPGYFPQMRVFRVIYHYPAAEPPYSFDTPPWRGFVSAQKLPFC